MSISEKRQKNDWTIKDFCRSKKFKVLNLRIKMMLNFPNN